MAEKLSEDQKKKLKECIKKDDVNESLLDKFSFLQQSGEQKQRIAKEILADGHGDKLYWLEIALSTLIATFGLLQNSVAVIIGAMLIAPLIKPMQAMSFAISSGQSRFFWRSAWFLAKSVFVSIFIAMVFAYIIPIKAETPEILARVTPNLLDLFIASFSAIIAFLAISYNRLSESVAGVAMAASLMPPLAVVGIEIALGNFVAAWGGFLLFWVNFLAILIVGVGMFVFYGFTPHQEIAKKLSFRKILTLITILLFTCIPLYSSLSKISSTIKIEKQVTVFLEEKIPEKIAGGSISEIHIVDLTEEKIILEGKISVPENIKIFQSSYDSLIVDLEKKFNKKMEIDFEMIRTANLSSPDQAATEKQNILQVFSGLLQEKFPTFVVLQTSIAFDDQKNWAIQPIVSLPIGEYLEDSEKQEFLDLLQKKFPQHIFTINWAAISAAPEKIITKKTPEELLQEDFLLHLEKFRSGYSESISFKDIQVKKDESESILLSVLILYPQQPTKLQYFDAQWSTIEISRDDIQDIVLYNRSDEEKIQQKILIDINTYLQELQYENIQTDIKFLGYNVL